LRHCFRPAPLASWAHRDIASDAADRGVKVRIYLDGSQLAERDPSKVFNDLAETPGAETKSKHRRAAPMHLKCYQIDGRLLRYYAALCHEARHAMRHASHPLMAESPERR
jgi:hypothetical protein